jgi:alcohol dehydrogenase/L-iditol 2-dehydrogenase
MAALSGADPLIVVGLTADTARLAAARQLGATRTVDFLTERLDDVLRECGARGADLVCDATGASRSLEEALRLVRPGGQVIKVGWSPEPVGIDMNPLVHRNVHLQGSFSHNYPVWERVIHLLDRGLTLPETIIGLRAPLEQWRSAFDAMHDRQVIKSVLLPQAT